MKVRATKALFSMTFPKLRWYLFFRSVGSTLLGFVGFAKSIPRVCDRKRAVTLRRHLDPIGSPVVRWRWRNIWSGLRSGHRSHRHAFRLVVDGIGNEHSGGSVLLPADEREMK